MKQTFVFAVCACLFVPSAPVRAQQRFKAQLDASAATLVTCPMSQATATMDTWTVAVQGDAYAGQNPQGNDRYSNIPVQFVDSSQHPDYALVPIPSGSTGSITLTGRNLCLFFTDTYAPDNHGSVTATITSSSGSQTVWNIYAVDAAITPFGTYSSGTTAGAWAISAQGTAFSGSAARQKYQKVVVWYDNPTIQQYEYALIDINGGSIGITGSGLIVFQTDTNDSDNHGSVSALITTLTIVP
jgi:hypothetical protein